MLRYRGRGYSGKDSRLLEVSLCAHVGLFSPYLWQRGRASAARGCRQKPRQFLAGEVLEEPVLVQVQWVLLAGY